MGKPAASRHSGSGPNVFPLWLDQTFNNQGGAKSHSTNSRRRPGQARDAPRVVIAEEMQVRVEKPLP